jgi:acetolactate synthase I/II/III large subunit
LGGAERNPTQQSWLLLGSTAFHPTYKLGYSSAKTQIAPTDFLMFARSMGADGICVESESQLETALSKAINSKVPFIVDVIINRTEPAPIGVRLASLITQIAK